MGTLLPILIAGAYFVFQVARDGRGKHSDEKKLAAEPQAATQLPAPIAAHVSEEPEKNASASAV
jgi:hypothetical protein